MDAFGHINPTSTSISTTPVEPLMEVGHLSASEKVRCYKEKLCYKCGKPGHFMAVCQSTPFNPPGPQGPQQNYQNPQGGGRLSRQWQSPQQQQQQLYQQHSQALIQESVTIVYGFDAPQFTGKTHTQVVEHAPPAEVPIDPVA
jgi:Zinc knuckle